MMNYYKFRRVYWISLKSKILYFLNKRKYRDYFSHLVGYFKDKSGIEIGGPSLLFSRKVFPVYDLSKTVDGCNFSSQTVWEGSITSNNYNYHPQKSGKQFICEGSDLSQINDDTYDFLLSCHNLEHLANPIKAVQEWRRVVKRGGLIVLVLPDKQFTFDRNREYTKLEHLITDYNNNTQEDDLTHLAEIIQLHDLSMDPGSQGDRHNFEERSKSNFQNRCFHHHVFSDETLKQLFDFLKMKTEIQCFIPPFNKIIIGRK